MPSPVILATATIQDDFTTVLSEVHAGIIPSENIWLSCYKDGEPSIHGKISVNLHEQDRDRVELVGGSGVELTRTSQVSLFFLEWKYSFVFVCRSVVVVVVGPFIRPLISSPGRPPPLISSGTPPGVQDSGSILWTSFLRAMFMRILHIRTRYV
jgi:hypothetical protein